MKVKVENFDKNDATLAKIKERNIGRLKQFMRSYPFATKVFVAMKTKLPMAFIKANWDKATK